MTVFVRRASVFCDQIILGCGVIGSQLVTLASNATTAAVAAAA